MYRPALLYLQDYLYDAWYDTIDYAFAYEWFRSHTPVVGGACSTVRKGNLIGRNLDWTYDESAEFIVHTNGVVGVANAIPGLTDAFVKSGADDEVYKIVPFMLSDGINKHGLVVTTLVVPTDKGDNSVVTPTVEETVELCTLMLPRYVLDNFPFASMACYWMMRYAKLYHPKTLQDQHYDQHFVIADADDTFCMEFVEGRYVIKDISSKPYVTNFHLSGVTFNADGSVYTPATGKASENGITDNGSGLERYNLINSYTGDISTLMRELAYTRAYQSSPDPAVPRWDTEFVGNGRTVDTPTAGYDAVQQLAAEEYARRERSTGTTWHTVHSVVYDVQDKKLVLHSQENYDTQWEVSVMAEQTHIQLLRGDTAKNDTFTGSAGEITVDTQTKTIRVHDGVKQGGYELVNTSEAQTVTGAKTFTTSPAVPTVGDSADASTKAASTAFVQGAIAANDANVVHKTGSEEIAGNKIFTNLVVNKSEVAGVRLFNQSISKGVPTDKTKTVYATRLYDKEGANTLAALFYAYGADKTQHLGMYCYKSDKPDDTAYTSIRCGFDKDGNAFTSAHTPPLTDNSTNIATTGWVKSVLPNANGFKVNPDGTVSVDFSQMDEATINSIRKEMGVKIPLTANKTFYVNGATGSDTIDDGRGESAAKPFKTIQACVDFITQNYSFGNNSVYVSVAAGDYAERVFVRNFDAVAGRLYIRAVVTGSVNVLGGIEISNTPSLVVSEGCNYTTDKSYYSAGVVGSIVVRCESGGKLRITKSRVYANTSTDFTIGLFSCIESSSLQTLEDITISGNISNAFYAQSSSVLTLGRDITVDGAFVCVYFAAADSGGMVIRGGISSSQRMQFVVNDSATGTRYIAATNGILNTYSGGDEFFPGTVAGRVQSGGQYV